MSGPTCTPGSSPGPTTMPAARSASGASILPAARPTTTATEPDRHRSPALPNAELRLDAAADLASRLIEGLAVVARDKRGQLLEVLLEDRLEAEHQAHPLHHRRLRPV